jgi:hypothetical protein
MGHRVVLRTWTYGVKQEALRRATTWRRAPEGGATPDVDPWRLNDELLLATVAEWDLKTPSGDPQPVSIEAIHAAEPPELIEEIIAEAQRLNGVTVEERKK